MAHVRSDACGFSSPCVFVVLCIDSCRNEGIGVSLMFWPPWFALCVWEMFSAQFAMTAYSLFTSLCIWWHMWVLMHVGFVVHVCTMINVCAGFCKNQGSESPKLFPAWSVLYMWAWPILVPTQNTMKEFSISIRTGWHMWGLMHVVFHVHVCSLFCVPTFAGMKKLGFPDCFGHLGLHCVHARCDLSWLT